MADRYAVFGNPIAQSRSPQIHQQFAQQTGEDLQYTAQLVDVHGFAQAAEAFFCAGGKGLNITMPFKLDAFNFADQLSPEAKRAGAVNTLVQQDNDLILGDTTDGKGLVTDIQVNLGWPIKDQKILILGAGGAVRGVLEPILAQKPQCLTIVNRTAEKAELLAKDFSDFGEINGGGYGLLEQQSFDLVINGTSASLAGDLPPLPDTLLHSKSFCYDMMYGAKPTVFMDWAKKHNAQAVADGLGMLVEQAAESFLLWRNKRPQTKPVIEQIRAWL